MTSYRDESLGYHQVDIGDIWLSASRTITETDVVSFAGLTGDYNPLHMDHNFARSTPFGRPIVHGLLGLSLVAGLGSHSPAMCTAAFVRVVDWKFLQPLFIGDTVHVETQVLNKQAKGRRHGLITWRRQLVNQDGITAQQGWFETLVKLPSAVA